LRRGEERDAEGTCCDEQRVTSDTHALSRKGQHPLASVQRPPGVTESGGRSRLSPLGTVASRHRAPIRFVHTPELVCNRSFEWSALRKHADVGLESTSNVATSMACPRPPSPSLVKAGLVGTTTAVDPTKPPAVAVGSLTRIPPAGMATPGPRGRAAASSYLYTGWDRLVYPRPALPL
jgi:hypothetical protein